MEPIQQTQLFDEYDATTRTVLREVLLIERQFITYPLRTNSSAFKELRDRIDTVIEGVAKHETG